MLVCGHRELSEAFNSETSRSSHAQTWGRMFQAEESNVQAWSWVVPSARPAGELGGRRPLLDGVSLGSEVL